MIESFGDKETEKIWNGISSKKLPFDIQNVARRKLRMISNAQNVNDLRIPSANHLEKLSRNLSESINNGVSFLFGKAIRLSKSKLLTTINK